MSALTTKGPYYSRPEYLTTGHSHVTWARLRFLNKIQELVPEFMVPLRDEMFPLWVSITDHANHRRDLEANQLVHTIATRLAEWTDDFQIGGSLCGEAHWQLQRWQESEPGTTLPLCFEREGEIAETQIVGCYPFDFIPTIEIEEEQVPECVSRIKPEAYACSSDYARAVYSVLGARGVWKKSPDHAGLDRRCEMLVRFHVLKQTVKEIIERMGLSEDDRTVRETIEKLAKVIGQELDTSAELQGSRER